MTKRILVPGSVGKLEKFKMEVAEDMGLLDNESKNAYMGDVNSGNVNNIKNSSNVGGEMVRRMVESAEKNMMNNNKLT